MHFIDIQRFNDLIDECCLGLEFIDMLNEPFENALGRKAKHFLPAKIETEDLERFNKTVSSLREFTKY